jgi:predicted GIY-YIG superfamily endonuclease
MHPPKKLIHFEEFNSRTEAMKREKRIKKLTHLQKLKLAHSRTRRHKSKKPIQSTSDHKKFCKESSK